MYWCRTIGQLALYADPAQTVPLVRAGKSLAILAYLGLRPQRCDSRDRVAALFWPDAPPRDAHHALRQARYRLRQAVPADLLVEGQENLLCCCECVAFDCLEGERALAAGDPERAFELLRGNFLEGFGIAESREFEEWAEAMRTRFRDGHASAGAAVAERALAAGRPDAALAAAEEIKAVNPLDEGRVSLFIRTLDRTGQTGRALAEYRAYASLLRRAVEDEPPAELQAYARELERSLPQMTEAGSPLPFVGRSQPWSKLISAWSAAEGGQCSAILIEGDAGLGKTRLIDEFAARVSARGAVWLAGKCHEIEQTLPYALASHALRSLERSSGTDGAIPAASSGAASGAFDLLALVADGDGRSGRSAYDGGSVELRLRARVVDWLHRLAADRPVLLSCDDIHWADAASLRLLHFIREDLAGSRILLICSYRPAELSPVARRFASSLATEGLATLVTLTPLAPQDVSAILHTLGRFPEPKLADALAADLHRHTGGNPLFIVELLDALADKHVLKLANGDWVTASTFRVEDLPKTLRKILADRVDALAPNLRHALEVMAVLGEAADPDLLAELLGISAPISELALVELGKARLVRRRSFGAYEVAHDELRQLVYSALPDDRRRQIHARVGDMLEARGAAAGPGGAARLARHFEQAGEAARARQYALAAANEAAQVGATEARQSYLRLAQAFDPGAPDDREAMTTLRWTRRLGRWLSYAAAAVLVGGAALVGIRGDSRSRVASAAPWQQGTLYLLQYVSGANLPGESFFRVEWPAQPGGGRIVSIDERPPELPPRLAALTLGMSDGSHTKIFKLSGSDTIQLTSGTTDDGPAVWSPDRSLIAVQRGWRVGDQYRFNIFVIDSAGRPRWQVTDGPQQDFLLDWSPDGSRIAFMRNADLSYALWISDVDGARGVNLSERLDLPTGEQWIAAFAPDGQRLALAPSSDPAVWVIDLAALLAARIPLGCAPQTAPAWSPDGLWLAAICRTAKSESLVVVSADGSSGPHVPAELPGGNWMPHWTGGRAKYIASLQITSEPPERRLRCGEGVRLTAVASDAAGERTETFVRWTALDPAIVSVDELGFVRAHAPGTARVEASAGGFRADTVSLEVSYAPTDTLLYESWTSGIDTTRWRFIGSPAPEVIVGGGPVGASALLSNGDHNWPSGVLSLEEYELASGLTLELPVRFNFTGGHWQELEVGLMRADRATVGNNERKPNRALAWSSFLGTSPTYREAQYTCGALRTWELATANAGWHHLVLQVRPDRVGECYLDGEFHGAWEISESQYVPKAALYLGGRSEGTLILHGPVLVTRGLRY